MVAESAEFTKAAADVKTLAKDPSNEQKLELYGLFKVGKGEEAKEAGMLDFKGKAMYSAWKKEKDAGTTPEQAQKKYVELVEKLKNEIGTK